MSTKNDAMQKHVQSSPVGVFLKFSLFIQQSKIWG